MPTRQELLAAALDPEFQKQLASNFRDTMLRGGIASNLGAPVDLYQAGKELFGAQPNPMAAGGSEWIGQKMQNMGLIGDYRNPATELVASFISPAMAMGAGNKLLNARNLIK